MGTNTKERGMKMVKIRIPIKAVPQGSHKSFIIHGKDGKNHIATTDSNHDAIMSSRVAIIEAYRKAGGINYGNKAIEIKVVFSFIRPKSVKEKKRPYMTVAPDTDKCCRMICDALTKTAFNDDSQVVSLTALKIYDESEYIDIEINEYNPSGQQTL